MSKFDQTYALRNWPSRMTRELAWVLGVIHASLDRSLYKLIQDNRKRGENSDKEVRHLDDPIISFTSNMTCRKIIAMIRKVFPGIVIGYSIYGVHLNSRQLHPFLINNRLISKNKDLPRAIAAQPEQTIKDAFWSGFEFSVHEGTNQNDTSSTMRLAKEKFTYKPM